MSGRTSIVIAHRLSTIRDTWVLNLRRKSKADDSVLP